MCILSWPTLHKLCNCYGSLLLQHLHVSTHFSWMVMILSISLSGMNHDKAGTRKGGWEIHPWVNETIKFFIASKLAKAVMLLIVSWPECLLTTLTEAFHSLLKFPQGNGTIVPYTRPRSLSSTSSSNNIHTYLIIQCCIVWIIDSIIQ
jgi:hypothetical protein